MTILRVSAELGRLQRWIQTAHHIAQNLPGPLIEVKGAVSAQSPGLRRPIFLIISFCITKVLLALAAFPGLVCWVS